jgi:hypothetical protein
MFGGAAVRINGFNISNILYSEANGSCLKIQEFLNLNNNFRDNISPLH